MHSSIFSLQNTSISGFCRYRKVVFYIFEVPIYRSKLKCDSEIVTPPYINLKFCVVPFLLHQRGCVVFVSKVAQLHTFVDIVVDCMCRNIECMCRAQMVFLPFYCCNGFLYSCSILIADSLVRCFIVSGWQSLNWGIKLLVQDLQ